MGKNQLRVDNFVGELEKNGINVIAESERHGKPRILFWPWAAGNVSLLALSYGSIFLSFGITVAQASWAAIIGVIGSFLLVGVSSLAGKKSNAPTMVLSRAIFGVKGNILPGLLSWLVFVGWETFLVALATLATATVLTHIHGVGSNQAKIIGFAFSYLLTVLGGIYGFKLIIKIQKWLTTITVLISIIYVALTFKKIKFTQINMLHHGSSAAFLGAMIVGIAGIGLGWVNSAADYSRYLPRNSNSASVIGWTVFGASIFPIIFVIYGALLSGSSSALSNSIAADPIGALTTVLPGWFLIPFAILAILGLVGGAILDLYSSGLTLVSIGIPIARHRAVAIDAVVMFAGVIYFVWYAPNFIGPLTSFLVTLGVPVAAWSAIFVADVLLRKSSYDEDSLYNSAGIYGSVNWVSLCILGISTFVGFGYVQSTTPSWLKWQGYFLNTLGGKNSIWGNSNVGVIFALLLAFLLYTLYFLLRRKRIKLI
jgi:purine-cytosine permease-like protein